MNTHTLRLSARDRAAVSNTVGRIRRTMRPWGIRVTDLAMELGVSRQYVWQVMHTRTFVSQEKLRVIESVVGHLIEERKRGTSLGAKLRAARIGAGLTLKGAASIIGYTWVAVERWEKDVCVPKPGILWHLRTVYGVDEHWFPIAGLAPTRKSPFTYLRQAVPLNR